MSYQAAQGNTPSQLVVTGNTSLTLPADSDPAQNLGITLANPGLVVQGGTVTALNATLTTGTIAAAGENIGDATGQQALNLNYTASASTSNLSVTGNASFTFSGQTLALAMPSPGLLIQNGKLTSLNATLTAGTITVAGVAIGDTPGGTNLSVIYVAAAKDLSFTGSTSVTFPNGSIAVNLGDPNASPPVTGLVIQNGVLTSLNGTANGSFDAYGLMATANLSVIYASNSLEMWGGLSLVRCHLGSQRHRDGRHQPDEPRACDQEQPASDAQRRP